MSSGSPTVAVVGLDGADWRLVRPLIEHGHMPNLAAMMQRGAWATMQSTDPPQSSAAWTSMCTGANPGRHGIVGFTALIPGTYETHIVRTGHVRVPYLWDILRQFDRKSIVSNIPSQYPPVDVNGVMITGFLTPDATSRWAHPPDITDELESRGLGFQPPVKVRQLLAAGHQRAIELVNTKARKQLSTIQYLLDRQQPDLLFCVFHTADVVQHAFLGLACHQAGSCDGQSHEQILQTPAGRVLVNHYAELDRIIGRIVGALPDDAAVMVVSDHGFGPKRKLLYTERWLQENGYLKRTSLPTMTDDPKNWRKRTTGDLLKRLGLGFIAPLISERTLQREIHTPRIGRIIRGGTVWRSTKAFPAPGTCGLGIRLNVKGREPMGTVAEGAEYEKLREELIDRLRELRDPDTGLTLCEGVWKGEDINPGGAYDHGPDVLMRLRDEFVSSPGNSRQWLVDPKPQRKAGHYRDGMFVAAGTRIRPAGQLKPISLLDIAPTVLALQGIEPPDGIEGTIVEAVQCTEPLHELPQTQQQTEDPQTGLTEDEEQQVTDRLRDLGYL